MRNLGWVRYAVLGAAVTTAAWAAPYKGRVLLDGAPAANIEVRAFASPSPAVPTCGGSDKSRMFGRCLCPQLEKAFGEQLMKGLEGAGAPLATATTGADGTFTLELSGGKAGILARSADGTLFAEGYSSKPADLHLERGQPVRVRLTGLTKNAAVYLTGMAGSGLERLEARDGMFVSTSVAGGMQMLLVAAEGAQTAMHMLMNGRPMQSMHLNPEEVTAIELGPVLPIRGTVLEDGRPAADVEVIADPENCATTTRTNAKGEFEFPHSTAKPYITNVIARAKGRFARQSASAGATVELELREGARLELTLVDEKGAPAGEQWVRLKGPSGEALRTDAAGKVTAEVPVGEVKLHVDSPWFLRDAAPFIARGTMKKKVVVVRGAVIKGRLVDPHGGKPGKHSVDARPVGNNDHFASRHGWSDENGVFTIEGLKPGRYEVSLFGRDKVEVSAPGQVELKAEVAHVITGSVVDPSGKPMKGANISAHSKEAPNHSWGTTSDEKGEFSLRVRGPGTYELTAGRGAAKQTVTTEVGVTTADAVKFELALSPSVTGKLTDAAGKPVAGELVEGILAGMPHMRMMPGGDPATMVMMAKASRMYHSAISAADGSFELPAQTPLTVFVSRGTSGVDPVTATPGTPITLVLKQRPVAKGRVVDASGRPVSRYSLNGLEVLHSDGRFEAPLFKSGPQVLTVSVEGSPDEKATVDAAEGVMSIEVPQIQLRRGYVIGGTVLGAITGKPARARVLATQAGLDPHRSIASVQPDGSFELRKLSEGPVQLKFESEEYSSTEVTATAGQTDLKVKLAPKGSLEVTVRKQRVAGKDVQVVLKGASGSPRSIRADSDGRAIFNGLEPGTYAIHTSDFGNAGPSKSVVIKPGAKAKLTLSTQ